MSAGGEGKAYNISANNFTIEESKIKMNINNKYSNCIFKTKNI